MGSWISEINEGWLDVGVCWLDVGGCWHCQMVTQRLDPGKTKNHREDSDENPSSMECFFSKTITVGAPEKIE